MCIILWHFIMQVDSRNQHHILHHKFQIQDCSMVTEISLVLLTLPPETTNLFFFIIMSFQEGSINGII